MGQKLKDELEALGLATLFFGVWFAGLLTLKEPSRAEYEIDVFVLSKVLVGAVILAKVDVLLDHVSLSGTTLSSR